MFFELFFQFVYRKKFQTKALILEGAYIIFEL